MELLDSMFSAIFQNVFICIKEKKIILVNDFCPIVSLSFSRGGEFVTYTWHKNNSL